MLAKNKRELLVFVIVSMTACVPTQNTPSHIPATAKSTEPPPSTPTPTFIPILPTITPTDPPLEFPPARGFSQLLFHPPSGKMILFGGESNRRTSYEDTWEYDPGTNIWMERFPNIHPSEADGSSAVYDSESDKFIFYFSVVLDSSATNGIRGISETWAYDFSTNIWENMNPTSHPEGIMGPRMAYDSESDRTILFGGGDFTASETTTFTETWAYDYDSNRWEKMKPSKTPIGRSYFGMAYAPEQDQVFVFGGSIQTQDEDRQNELWAYDYNTDTWNEINFSGAPNPGHHPAMAYNPITNQLLYLVNTNLNAFDLDTLSWETIADGPTNLPIHFHAMAVDVSGNLIVFGGGARGLAYNNRTYKYSLTTQEWDNLSP